MSDFDETTWRTGAAAKLQQFQQWLRHGDAPYVAYGTVAGLSLWPVVEAAAQAPSGQLPVSLILALGSLAGTVGANLLVGQLQQWRDQAVPVSENQVITWIQENIATQPDLLPTLDAITHKLDAVSTVQSSLSAADQTWFKQTLRQELAQLGNQTHYEAVLHGSGAVAQGDGAVAVGERGVNVAGNGTGPIITGDSNTIVYTLPPSAAATGLPPELRPLRHLMMQAFNLGELRTLAFDLQIAYDDLPHHTRPELVESLLTTCYHTNRLSALVDLCRHLRPHLSWPRLP